MNEFEVVLNKKEIKLLRVRDAAEKGVPPTHWHAGRLLAHADDLKVWREKRGIPSKGPT